MSLKQVRAALAVTAMIGLMLAGPAVAEDWPQWRGADRDAISGETGLMERWPDGGPPVAWAVENVGVGYSSLSVVDGRIYTQGDLEGVEHVICLRESDGQRVWATSPRPNSEGYRNNRGDGPRGAPTVEDGRVYTVGGRGDVLCLDAESGEKVWHVSFTEDLGGEVPTWGYSESPLIVGEMVIVTPGADGGTVVALNKNTGEVIWRSGGITEPAHYSSAIVAELAGKRQIVQMAADSVFGLDADTGELLWRYEAPTNDVANICTPVASGDYVFATTAYGTGGGLVNVERSGDGFTADEVYFSDEMAVHHGGVVHLGDHLYGFAKGRLICMDFMTGQIAWSEQSVRKGSIVAADGMLYCLSEHHEMALVEATPEGYRERGRFEIEYLGKPSWAHPVVANGRLYIRNQQELTAYDISAQAARR